MKKEYIVMGLCAVLVVGAVGGITFMKQKAQRTETEVHYSYATTNAEEITKLSARIVVGTITQKEVKDVTKDGEQTVMTYYTLTAKEHIKGTATPSITLEHEGGQSPSSDYGVLTSDPTLEKGKTYFLFLRDETSGNYGILGGPQGKYTVQGSDIVEQDMAKSVFGLSEKVNLQKMKEIVKKYL